MVALALAVSIMAAPTPVHSLELTPIYTLPLRAADPLGLADLVRQPAVSLKPMPEREAPRLGDLSPDDAIWSLLAAEDVPSGPFSLELWILEHINTPTGFVMAQHAAGNAGRAPWQLSYYDGMARFSGGSEANGNTPELEMGDRWNAWWRHLVVTYDGATARVYSNSERLLENEVGPLEGEAGDLAVWLYAPDEPYMQVGNLVREVHLFDRSLNASEVEERFFRLQDKTREAIVFSDRLHFTAGPKLQNVTQDAITVLVETSQPTELEVRWGEDASVPNRKSFVQTDDDRLHEVRIDGLESGQPYFYQVVAAEGLETGTLSFETAPSPDQAFVFAVWGDTETRPHINDRIAKLAWEARPNFVVNAGDLTDGGMQARRFEWTYEYFPAMTQLYSRVPAFTVPGNGEADLVWYNRYHANPAPENYYTFRYGNAQFFMLDSNRELGPGSEQFEWLETQLESSDATWKFAVHHHPTYSSDEDDYGNRWQGRSETMGDAKVQQLLPLYEEHGVDMVFYGHLHTYERSWPIRGGQVVDKGTIHVQTGGAGGNLENAAPTRSWFSATTYRGHHLCILEVNGNRIDFKMVDLEGRIRDRFTLEK
ncbi:MAG: metallophosphoesterase [Fimbriimonadaceae bacterium]